MITPRPDAVIRWLHALAADVDGRPDVGLSPEGRDEALRLALDALDPSSLAVAWGMPGQPFLRATFVAARTVVTAPLEWLAVLLGRGTRVVLKHPRGEPGLAGWYAAHAHAVDLPLEVTDEDDALRRSDLVIAMGGDDTIRALDDRLPDVVRFLGFGHRVSVAWLGRDVHGSEPWPEAVVDDLVRHDSRGCMSPVAVFTDQPVAALARRLADALVAAQRRLPRGPCAPAELAAIRSRDQLAQVLGVQPETVPVPEVHTPWRVHVMPPEHAVPVALPRALQLVPVRSCEEAADWTASWGVPLSTFGHTPLRDPHGTQVGRFTALGASRACLLGEMQTPPLLRIHDGVDLVEATLRGRWRAPEP